jgi:hypothetical protein
MAPTTVSRGSTKPVATPRMNGDRAEGRSTELVAAFNRVRALRLQT